MINEEMSDVEKEIVIGKLMSKLSYYSYAEKNMLSLALQRSIENDLKEHLNSMNERLDKWCNHDFSR
jgi:hypothetical protein